MLASYLPVNYIESKLSLIVNKPRYSNCYQVDWRLLFIFYFTRTKNFRTHYLTNCWFDPLTTWRLRKLGLFNNFLKWSNLLNSDWKSEKPWVTLSRKNIPASCWYGISGNWACAGSNRFKIRSETEAWTIANNIINFIFGWLILIMSIWSRVYKVDFINNSAKLSKKKCVSKKFQDK